MWYPRLPSCRQASRGGSEGIPSTLRSAARAALSSARVLRSAAIAAHVGSWRLLAVAACAGHQSPPSAHRPRGPRGACCARCPPATLPYPCPPSGCPEYLTLARRFADAMLAHGRDTYGAQQGAMFACLLLIQEAVRGMLGGPQGGHPRGGPRGPGPRGASQGGSPGGVPWGASQGGLLAACRRSRRAGWARLAGQAPRRRLLRGAPPGPPAACAVADQHHHHLPALASQPPGGTSCLGALRPSAAYGPHTPLRPPRLPTSAPSAPRACPAQSRSCPRSPSRTSPLAPPSFPTSTAPVSPAPPGPACPPGSQQGVLPASRLCCVPASLPACKQRIPRAQRQPCRGTASRASPAARRFRPRTCPLPPPPPPPAQ